jgi:hypothetical protein
MKIIFNNDTVKRVISNGSCIGCWCNNNTASCNPTLIDLCTAKDNCYLFRPYKPTDSIFLI